MSNSNNKFKTQEFVEGQRSITYSVTLPKNILDKVDEIRGLIPRSTWNRDLIIREIKRLEKMLEGGGAN